jgi:hypothetical protein
MTFAAITPAQLRRLQTLYSQCVSKLDLDRSRESRMAWASQELKKPIASFSELSSADAKRLLDSLQLSMGIPQTSPPRRQRVNKKTAQKYGTEGRHDQIHAETTMLDGTEEVFRKIQVEMSALGWDEGRLKAFLRSASGPNDGRDTIRTLADANHVHWALKRMIDRAAARTYLPRRAKKSHQPAKHGTGVAA